MNDKLLFEIALKAVNKGWDGDKLNNFCEDYWEEDSLTIFKYYLEIKEYGIDWAKEALNKFK